MTELNLMNSNV